jgi:hypothetical protein
VLNSIAAQVIEIMLGQTKKKVVCYNGTLSLKRANGMLSFHRWKRAVIATLENQPYAIPSTLGLER